TPIGAVQGWDPSSYAKAAQSYVKMGYNYLGIGGLVRSTTKDILRILDEIRQLIPRMFVIYKIIIINVTRFSFLQTIKHAGQFVFI
ncbi:MAG TPA: hypothetical protein EYO26_05210, partial [Dehalococcoidia bacterium]|nr:hypothetical protein [Dehalococcoidia bacterium]